MKTINEFNQSIEEAAAPNITLRPLEVRKREFNSIKNSILRDRTIRDIFKNESNNDLFDFVDFTYCDIASELAKRENASQDGRTENRIKSKIDNGKDEDEMLGVTFDGLDECNKHYEQNQEIDYDLCNDLWCYYEYPSKSQATIEILINNNWDWANNPDDEGIEILKSTILHELVHAFQMHEMPFFYENQEVEDDNGNIVRKQKGMKIHKNPIYREMCSKIDEATGINPDAVIYSYSKNGVYYHTYDPNTIPNHRPNLPNGKDLSHADEVNESVSVEVSSIKGSELVGSKPKTVIHKGSKVWKEINGTHQINHAADSTIPCKVVKIEKKLNKKTNKMDYWVSAKSKDDKGKELYYYDWAYKFFNAKDKTNK